VTLRTADESVVRYWRELLAIFDDSISQVGVKFACETEESVPIGWWIITEATD
jgi:hypothetical protein